MRLFDVMKRNGIYGTIYKIWDRIFHRPMPIPLGRTTSPVITYDGSNQSVHPDLIVFDGKLVLIYTPYPFGVDTYENPSAAFILEGAGVEPIRNCQPLVAETDHNFHLSDPSLYIDHSKLFVIYRRTRKSDPKDNELFCVGTKDFVYWDNPRKIVSSKNNDLISPAIIGSDEKWLI